MLQKAKVIGFVDMDNTKVIFPKEYPTYNEYKELVDKVYNSRMSFMCSAIASSASYVRKIYQEKFKFDLTEYYNTFRLEKGKLFNYTGD